MTQQLSFARDIRPLFRDRDIQSMQSAFDLASYDDVRTHGEPIYAVLAAGQMPCDGPWPRKMCSGSGPGSTRAHSLSVSPGSAPSRSKKPPVGPSTGISA